MADEEKKGGKVSGFFKSIGNKFNDATYDMRAESDFSKNHATYVVYTGATILSHTVELAAEEHFGGEENYVVILGEYDEIAPGQIIVAVEGDSPKYIAAVEKTTLTFEFEGKQNEKPAMKLTLGAPAEKVEVIRVGEDFYLKK